MFKKLIANTVVIILFKIKIIIPIKLGLQPKALINKPEERVVKQWRCSLCRERKEPWREETKGSHFGKKLNNENEFMSLSCYPTSQFQFFLSQVNGGYQVLNYLFPK